MSTRTKIAIGVVAIAAILLILYYASKPKPVVVYTVAHCPGGAYKDGSSIAPADAQLGSVVCGGGNIAYNCSQSGGWAQQGQCVAGMKGY